MMNRRNTFPLKIIFYLFFINSISLYVYFSFHGNHHIFPFKSQLGNHSFPTETEKKPSPGNSISSVNSHYRRKPWPILPSFLPWSLNPNVDKHSCEGYFGNGFNRRIDLLQSSSNYNGGGGGWFRCFYSETLESSICEGGKVKMNLERILMSKGGEDLESVIGRDEEYELPVFYPGAFEIEVSEEIIQSGNKNITRRKIVNEEFLDKFVSQGSIDRHTMRNLIDTIRLVGSNEFHCSEWIDEPTLLVTRFEYANLFHTVTDWYGAYAASRVIGLPYRPHLIFLDGHCKAQLEETWEVLFSSVRYAKSFNDSVCFRHAILSPLGYETALFKGLSEVINCQGAEAQNISQNPNNKKTTRLTEFGEMIKASFDLPLDSIREEPVSENKILFIRREDYLAHPRHDGKVESRLTNEQEVFEGIKNWIDNRNSNNLKCNVSLVNGLFAHMGMKEQVQAIQEASIIIGAHGAGLTHTIAATPKTVILEIISSFFRRPHFALIAQWRGLEYHAINLDGSYAHPELVIDKLSFLISSLGC